MEHDLLAALKPFHSDVASLRREMVDTGLLARTAGVYRRPA